LKYLVLCLLLAGCGGARVNYTVFLKEEESRLYNLKGDDCTVSGFQLDKDGTKLTTYYGNCEIHSERKLKEFEPEQWKGKVNAVH
jgi:hypothetical protein